MYSNGDAAAAADARCGQTLNGEVIFLRTCWRTEWIDLYAIEIAIAIDCDCYTTP